MTSQRTYLDYNASAPLRLEARAALLSALECSANPSSVHADGRQARATIEAARLVVAQLVGARPADLVFTSGASESNATVLAGRWDTIFLSALEHDSIRAAARKNGARLVDVPLTPQGLFDVAAFATLASNDEGNALLCLQLANNETGVIQPVAAAAAIARARGVRVHCDAVQAPGRIPVDCTSLGADYLTISAHKLGGPKGVGALVAVNGAPLAVLIAGGGQERGHRAGTENVAGIAGFGAAAKIAQSETQDTNRIRALRDRLEREVAASTPNVVVVGRDADRLCNTSCLALAGLAADAVVIRLDLAGVDVSAGAACSSGKVGQSATLAAMGLPTELARSSIRVSFGPGNNDADIDAFLAAWTTISASTRRAA